MSFELDPFAALAKLEPEYNPRKRGAMTRSVMVENHDQNFMKTASLDQSISGAFGIKFDKQKKRNDKGLMNMSLQSTRTKDVSEVEKLLNASIYKETNDHMSSYRLKQNSNKIKNLAQRMQSRNNYSKSVLITEKRHLKAKPVRQDSQPSTVFNEKMIRQMPTARPLLNERSGSVMETLKDSQTPFYATNQIMRHGSVGHEEHKASPRQKKIQRGSGFELNKGLHKERSSQLKIVKDARINRVYNKSIDAAANFRFSSLQISPRDLASIGSAADTQLQTVE